MTDKDRVAFEKWHEDFYGEKPYRCGAGYDRIVAQQRWEAWQGCHAHYADELQAEREKVRKLAMQVAHEAHTMGRIYARTGEKDSPAQVCVRVERMVDRHIIAARIAEQEEALRSQTETANKEQPK